MPSFYEDEVSSSEKCLNYVKRIGITNDKQINISNNDNLCQWDDIPVEIEVADLQSSSTECPQFPELEEIHSDTGSKPTEQDSEPEEVLIERIDLIPDVTIVNDNTINFNIEKQVNTHNTKLADNTVTIDTEGLSEEQPTYTKLEEIDLLSSIGRDIGVDLEKYVQPVPDVVAMEAVDVHTTSCPLPGLVKDTIREDTNKLMEHELMESTADSRKKEKMARNQARRRQQSHNGHQRRPDKRRAEQGDKAPGGFDVYNIETAMPKIDLDAIESHLLAAREEERRVC